MNTIDAIAQQCHRTSMEHGFWDHETVTEDTLAGDIIIRNPSIVGEKLALIHSEVSEALEQARNGNGRDEIMEELADVVIRVFDLAVWIQQDSMSIGEMVREKMSRNQKRPHKHGKEF